MCCGRGFNGKPCQKICLAVPVRSMRTFASGSKPVPLRLFGDKGLQNMKKWKESLGSGNRLMPECTKPRLLKRLLEKIRQTGGKKGSKRHLLVDGHGVPLSAAVTGANVHDINGLQEVFAARAIAPRDSAEVERLCADGGYRGKRAAGFIADAGFEGHVKTTESEFDEKKHNANYKPRQWVVEVALPWFAKLRKLLVRFEKLLSTHMVFTYLAAAIIVYRKIDIIYG